MTWLLLAIPLAIVFVHYLLAGQELWIIVCFGGIFLYMLMELLLDYVLKIEFRKKLSVHVPYRYSHNGRCVLLGDGVNVGKQSPADHATCAARFAWHCRLAQLNG